jgi:hypothetical protein
VDRWEIQQPGIGDDVWLLDPDYLVPPQGVEQRVPPTEVEVDALLEAFLRARVGGAGAERYLLRDPGAWPDTEVPLLYTTTGSDPFERFEMDRVQGPTWPNGRMEYKVRLFAGTDTMVEQYFDVVLLEDGQLGLLYHADMPDKLPTIENGQSVAVPYSILDDNVAFAAAPPWGRPMGDPSDTYRRLQLGREEFVVIGSDPLPGCENAPAPADAETLALRIMADPNSETTGMVPVQIAGLEALRMDLVVNDYSCWVGWGPDQLGRWRTRLYLVDYPGELGKVLAIAVIAPEIDFARVLEDATPILDSLEINSGGR